MSPFQEWTAYLRNCTDRQVQGVYDKEKQRLQLEQLDTGVRNDSQAAVDACLMEAERRELVLNQGDIDD
jgi:hypothetical protein